ncbi:hypothetical protein AWB77_00525 [Caballeronia fortuita]|uniref:Uncharacterized protein n=1 Tax=Caballeronia fortuita TaxID=1777138 RepID=A0A157ZBX2_9BURK|nr:hypothetical protein [Caballeronia fortuita]SAK43036.1 hypothetical protein AWB77_00525 [Caballeronia fortuita]
MGVKRKLSNFLDLDAYSSLEQRAIIEDLDAYSGYARPETSGWISGSFELAKTSLIPSLLRRLHLVLLLLECFLQVTKHKLTGLRWEGNQSTWERFIGAIYSPSFFAASTSRRYELTRCLVLALECTDWRAPRDWVKRHYPVYNLTTGAIERCLERYESSELKVKAVRLWMNWPGSNIKGDRTWFELFEVRQNFGQKFTHEFHVACAAFFSRRRSTRIPLQRELPAFMAANVNLTLRARTDGEASTDFFRALSVYYLKNKSPKLSIDSAVIIWRCEFFTFANSLISQGIFAEPDAGIPSPPDRHVVGSRTHTKIIDGIETRTKTVTPIALLPLADEEALSALRERVQLDIDTLRQWATAKIDIVWKRYLTRVKSWQLGRPHPLYRRETPAENSGGRRPSALENAAATLHYNGYVCADDCIDENHYNLESIFGGDSLTNIAQALGLPTLGTLLPFATLLVIENNEITPAFLETSELYSKDGSRTGFGRTQGGYFVRGFKHRKGKGQAEQTLLVNSASARTLLQIICLTKVCREYLKKQKNDSAHFLLLSTGRAFGYPTRLRRTVDMIGSDRSRRDLSLEFVNLAGCSKEYADYLVTGFGLSPIRAQLVTKLYLDTHDTAEVARALGHSRFRYRQVCRYVPENVVNFFMERWVRIHQTRFVVEALVDSPYRLVASGLANESELVQFMENHCTDLHQTESFSNDGPPGVRERLKDATTLIGIDAGVMTVLCSISVACAGGSRVPSARANFWVEVADPLIAEIESIREIRPDLARYLDEGRALADAALVEEIIFE